MLVTWPFERADREGVACYLETDLDLKVMALFERNGFVKVDECHIEVELLGYEGFYTNVAMVREPKAVAGQSG